MKNVEMNEIQSRVNRKRASLTFQNQQSAIESASNELRQIRKQEAYETDDETAKLNVLRRIELEDMLETLPSDEVKRVGRMEENVRKLQAELNQISGELVKCSAEMETLEQKVKEQQDTFDIKRNNFETVQRDFTLASLLSVQEIENKTRNVATVDRTGLIASPSSSFRKEAEPLLLVEPKEDLAISIRSDEEVPSAFTCPITSEVMKDPVLVPETGHSYERQAIERWFSTHDTDPMTGVRVTHKTLAPNHSLRRMIQESVHKK
jgi:hypothetical protein